METHTSDSHWPNSSLSVLNHISDASPELNILIEGPLAKFSKQDESTTFLN